MLYPGHAAEDDYPLLAKLLGPDVALPLVHTTEQDVPHTVEALLAVGQPEELAAGWRQLTAHHQPQSVVWACTSGSFVFGWDGAAEQARTLTETAGAPASSTSIAFARACHAVGARRVAVAATYPEDVASKFVEFLGDGGLDVVNFGSEGIFLAGDVGTLDEAAVLALAVGGDHADADAVLLPDTALHSVAWLDALEARVGKPVLTANQVTAWEGLRLAGDTTPRTGLGTLFENRSAGGAAPATN
ncbi:MAG: maleate cis-trans isomerase [Streptosporangiales bacterium]|nr:maleate cis-trans isomerase [Streptosporangiales bacterium]